MLTAELREIKDLWGIVFDECKDFLDSDAGQQAAAKVVYDAAPFSIQSQGVTQANAGVLAMVLTYMDPELTRVLTTPMKAAEILGQAKKGDWEDLQVTFKLVESAGETSVYGDDNENGVVDANVNYEWRQPLVYQCLTKWGDMETARYGKAALNWAGEQNIASAKVMQKYEDRIYWFGVSGLQNFGLLNDPALPPPIVAAAAWDTLSTKEIFAEFKKIFGQLQKQTGGIVEATDPLVCGLSPETDNQLVTATDFNVSVKQMIKTAYPNIRFVPAVQYATQAGELIQLWAEKLEGQTVGVCSFTEKMRAHRIVEGHSSISQKKSAGATGAIIKLPVGVASYLGA